MGLTINEKFKNLIPPQQPCEYQILEENILRDGCTTPLDVWPHDGKVELLDGHHRYKICTEHSIPYETREVYLGSEEDAQIWIIRNQFGRRNLTNYQRAELAFVLEPLIAARAKERQGQRNDLNIRENSHECYEKGRTDESLAKIAGISSNTIRRAKIIKEKGTTEQIERARKGGRGNSVNAIYTEIQHKDITEKTCPMCGKTLPINRFYGEGATCKTCTETRKQVLLAGGKVSYKIDAKEVGYGHNEAVKMNKTIQSVISSMLDNGQEVEHSMEDFVESLEFVCDEFIGKILSAVDTYVQFGVIRDGVSMGPGKKILLSAIEKVRKIMEELE